MDRPDVRAFFDEETYTVSYVVADPASHRAAVIDPVLGYDPVSGRTSTEPSAEVLGYIQEYHLINDWIFETHIHADHVTAAPYIKESTGGTIAAGAHVTSVQQTFKAVFNLESLECDGSQFDHLFEADETFQLGDIGCRVLFTPGHTPACVTYVIGDAAFVGDTMFMPDYGTARCDFPGGNAAQLYDSIQAILSLPDDTRLFMCHDYKAPGRDEYAWETTVAEQREKNVHFGDGMSKGDYVEMRERRDSGLDVPTLILPSIQVNIRAGQFPPPEDNQTRYLKIPIDAL
ncbi:MAG: MBL fold metallo-hydrolase [Woeseiaceae bacterium]